MAAGRGDLNIQDQIAELTGLAVDFFEGGKLDESESLLSTLLSIDPDNLVSIKYLGLIEATKGAHRQAITRLSRYIALKGDDPVACNVLSACHFEIGDCQGALEFADRAIQLHGAYQAAHNNRGTALNGLGRYEEALAAFQMSLAIDPRDPVAMINIGNALRA